MRTSSKRSARSAASRGQGFLFAGPVAAEEADVLLGVLRPGLALLPATARGYQREDVEVLLR